MTRSLLTLLLISSPALAHEGPGYLWNPVVTHTNGMRIASTTSLRSHNVHWQCDPGHVGYCDGKIHSPCRNEWRQIGTRCHGRYVPPYTPQGPTSSQAHHAMDGLELGDGETLGLLGARNPAGLTSSTPPGSPGPAQTNALAPIAAQLQAAPDTQVAPETDTWFDALQTLGRKMANQQN